MYSLSSTQTQLRLTDGAICDDSTVVVAATRKIQLDWLVPRLSVDAYFFAKLN